MENAREAAEKRARSSEEGLAEEVGRAEEHARALEIARAEGNELKSQHENDALRIATLEKKVYRVVSRKTRYFWRLVPRFAALRVHQGVAVEHKRLSVTYCNGMEGLLRNHTTAALWQREFCGTILRALSIQIVKRVKSAVHTRLHVLIAHKRLRLSLKHRKVSFR